MFAKIWGRRTTALATTLAVVVGLAITPAFTATAAEGDEPVVVEPAAVADAIAPVVELEAAAPVAPTVEALVVAQESAPAVELVEAPATEGESQSQSPIGPLNLLAADPLPEIRTQSLPNALIGVAYNQVLDADRSPSRGLNDFRVVTGQLPPGLTLESKDGAIQGTVTGNISQRYDFSITLSIKGQGNNVTTSQPRALSITVGHAAPVVTTSSLPGATVDTLYSQQLAASNGPNTFTVSQGSLPAGLTLSPSGEISGTPTFVDGYDGSDTITFSVIANNGSDSAAKQLSITVATPAPQFGDTTLAAATVGVPYSQTLLATGYGTLTYSLLSRSFPPGLTLGSNGVITGTPLYAGTYPPTQDIQFDVRVDGPTGWDQQTFILTLNVTAPTITTTTLPEAWLTETYSQAIATTGPSVTVTASNMPAGLRLEGTPDTGYAITGTPTASGDLAVELIASNVGGSVSVTLTLTVNAAPVFVTTSPLSNAVVGSAYSATVEATGADVTYSLVRGPAGMVIDPATGELSGWTPADETNVSVRVAAGNRSGTVERGFVIKPFAVPVIATTMLDSGKVGESYSDQIEFDGRNAKIQKTAGSLPNGVSLSRTDGILSGTPTKSGVFAFTVTVTNDAGTATANYEIRVHDVPVIHVTNLTRAIVGQAYTDAVVFSGLDAEATVIRGTLPAGMTLNADGTFSGTPTETGAFAFTVKVSNPAGSVQHRYRMVSVDAPVFQTANLNHGIVGMAYSQQLAADGFQVRFTVLRTSSLPAGLTLDSNGLLRGTPTVAGDYTFDVRARNAAGVTVQTFTLTATQPAATLSAPSVIRGNSLTVSGSGYLPGDDLELWLHSTPVLLGTVTATNGTFTKTVLIPASTDAGGHHVVVTGAQSGTQSVPLTVASPAPASAPAPQPSTPSTTQSRSPQLTVTPADTTAAATGAATDDEPVATEVEENEAEEDLPTLNEPKAAEETAASTPVNWTGLLVAAFALLLAALALWFILWRRRRAMES